MYRTVIAVMALASAPLTVLAEPAAAPAIVETDAHGSHTLLQCGANEMPVYTEGDTVEYFDGKETHSAHGILKCVAITQTVRNTGAGGSASLSWDKGRKVEVVNCPAGTVPFAMGVAHISVNFDRSKPMPHYAAWAPVLLRCWETADFGAQGR